MRLNTKNLRAMDCGETRCFLCPHTKDKDAHIFAKRLGYVVKTSRAWVFESAGVKPITGVLVTRRK